MDKQTAETLISVFSFLSKNDKLHCIRVCRQWYQLITTADLYNQMELTSLEIFQKAISMFQNKEHLGQYVGDLGVRRVSNLDRDAILSIQTLFPNIKSFKWHESWDHEKSDLNDPAHLISPLLLQKGMFRFLRELELDYSDMGYVENGVPRSSSVIAHLNNAPALQVPSITKAQFILEDMEYLHTAAPQLQELKLGAMDISDLQAIRESSISPASSLKSLYFGLDTEPFELNEEKQANYIVPWIKYFGEKYGNLAFQVRS